MIVRNLNEIKKTDREIRCPRGGFISYRYLLERDKMKFTITRTIIPVSGKQFWHYKNHLEACYCIRGRGLLTNVLNGETYNIYPGTMYALNYNEPHEFEAITEVTLICVFNPPLEGREIHKEDGSY